MLLSAYRWRHHAQRRILSSSFFFIMCSVSVLLNLHNISEYTENETYNGLSKTNHTAAQPRGQEPRQKNGHEELLLYWNLSCPAEMSIFSAIHIGGEHFENRAKKAALETSKKLFDWDSNWWLSEAFFLEKKKRILFVGDSLLRQVYISLVCMSANHITEYTIPWYDAERPAPTRYKRGISIGPHSKFEEAMVQLDGRENKIQLVYDHDMGNLLRLGPDYNTHDTNNWLKSCWLGQPLQTLIVEATTASSATSQHNIQRTRNTLNSNDTIVLNASLHSDRSISLYNIRDLALCVRDSPQVDLYPKLVYMVTSMEHFPTVSGQWDASLLDGKQTTYECRKKSVSSTRQAEERGVLQGILPIIGEEWLDFQSNSGDLHVGGRDCLHWAQPGVPDLLAASVVDHLQA